MERNAPSQIPALDGLRGIAVISVVIVHAFYTADTNSPHARVFHWFGFFGHGVTLFFVLSGFLITRILLSAKGSANYFKAFYARRVLRIFPLYYSALTIVCLACHITFRNWAGYALYLQNIFPNKITALPILHFWSLAVEEQFYLVWPLIVFFCSRKSVAVLCGVLVILAVACRIVIWNRTHDFNTVSWFPISNFDSLAMGAFLALVESDFARLRTLFKAAILSGVVVFVATWNSGNFESAINFAGSKTSMALVFAGVIGLCNPNGIFANRVLMLFGKYSYGIYVWHFPIYIFLFFNHRHEWTALQNVGVFCALLALSFLAALASWYLYEARFIALKRFFPMK